ncbi:MAG: DUF1385 domain-containing protein [Cryobacterium sp.]|nr:DUF1385 domain-containing protein [Oligoflexia bacterium]
MGVIASAANASSVKVVSKQFTSIGGQAVLEGVMMRSPNFITVAVRRPDSGKIVIKHDPYSTVLRKYPLLAKPFIRGVATLVESMVQGMGALSFSAEIGTESVASTEPVEKISRTQIVGSMIFAFAMGMLLFVALPHALTALLTSDRYLGISAKSPLFHLIDGTFKMIILMGYIYAISRMAEIRRVFQYHGAEHKSIYAFEAGDELTVENARKHSTLHPRCGTSFLLFLVLISIAVFSILLPVLGLTNFSDTAWKNHLGMIAAKMLLMFPVAGIAYEFIKLCACRMDNALFRLAILPGMLLQKLTTLEPDDAQLEVALASLRQCLRLEKKVETKESGFEVTDLDELFYLGAVVGEFPEL